MSQENPKKNTERREAISKKGAIYISILVPVLTIIVSVITTLLTIQNNIDVEKLSYTQKKIDALIAENDIVKSRKVLKFLVEGDLIGTKKNKEAILASLDKNLIDETESVINFLEGTRCFDIAFYYTDSLRGNPDSSQAYFIKAIDFLSKSLVLNPANYEARSTLGDCYSNLGIDLNLDLLHEKAIAEYDKALKIDTGISYIYANKASTLDILKRHEEACEIAKQALTFKDLNGRSQKRMREIIDKRCPRAK